MRSEFTQSLSSRNISLIFINYVNYLIHIRIKQKFNVHQCLPKTIMRTFTSYFECRVFIFILTLSWANKTINEDFILFLNKGNISLILIQNYKKTLYHRRISEILNEMKDNSFLNNLKINLAIKCYLIL